MKQEELFFALNETAHALRFAAAAASRFNIDPNQLEGTSATAASLTFIWNQLIEAQTSLSAAEAEISELIEADVS